MTPYILIFAMVSISALIESRLIRKEADVFYISGLRKTLNWLVLIVLILISGTRLIGGTDYYWYENAYKATPLLNDYFVNPNQILNVNWTSTLDSGYILICSLFKTIGLDFYRFCLVESAFFYVAMYLGLRKYCNNFSMVLLVFLAKMFFYDTFISMRQSITIAIFFLSLPLIENRKFVKYLFICLLCFFIHAGSIIMVAAYFLTYIDVSKRVFRNWLLIFTPFAILGLFGIDILGLIEPIITQILSFSSSLWRYKARGYLLNYSSRLSILYFFEYMLIALLLYMNIEKVNEIGHETDFFIKIFMVIWPLLALFSNTEIITREKDYFILSYGLLLCYFSHMSERRYHQVYVFGTVIICGYEFFRFINNFDAGGMVPYLSWLF